ncbi:protein of unknown function [Pararobbsia alpina]
MALAMRVLVFDAAGAEGLRDVVVMSGIPERNKELGAARRKQVRGKAPDFTRWAPARFAETRARPICFFGPRAYAVRRLPA